MRTVISGAFRKLLRIIRNMLVSAACEFFLLFFLGVGKSRRIILNMLSQSSHNTKIKSVVHISMMSHQQYYLSRAFRRYGVKSTFVALNTDPAGRLNVGYDYGVPINLSPGMSMVRRFLILWCVVARFDVVHYHFNAFLWGEDGKELPYLRRLNKLIVFHFRGCDLRSRSMNTQAHPALNVCQECDYPIGSCDTDYQRNKLKRVREYGDLFFATTPDLAVLFKGAIHVPFLLPEEIDFDTIVPESRTKDIFRVVTSSNHPGLDGVPYIRRAIDRLKSQGYRIELREVLQEPFEKTLSAYKSADLYVSKLRMGFYNNSNIETMMMSIANISYINDDYQSIVPDCPIIVSTPDTVYERIKFCVDNKGFVEKRANDGPDFVRRYHDQSIVIPMMLKHYDDAYWLKKSSMA